MEYKTLGGILLAIILTATTTVYIKEATGYKSCSTGWVLQDNGQFVCESRDIAPQWCYKFSDPNKETGISSRCYLGVPVEAEESKIEFREQIISDSGDYTTSIDGKTCYIKGNLRMGVPCEGI